MTLHKIKCLVILLLCILSTTTQAQDTINTKLQISILTCGPGQDLYAQFGHTGLRVKDSINNTDLVFNYGMFEYGEGIQFYLDFITGKLPYYVAPQNFDNFMAEYSYDQRSVTEQILNLTQNQKNNLYQYLNNNCTPQNKYYAYDFFFDNCSTRIDSAIQNQLKLNLQALKAQNTKLTFRQIIENSLYSKKWISFGINILFGKPTDDTMSQYHTHFLPFHLQNYLSTIKVNNNPLVIKQNQLLPQGQNVNAASPITPLWVFSFVSLLLLIATLYFKNQNPLWLRSIDSLMLFTTGLLGLLILFMMFGTNHQVCHKNFNILWALPLNIIFCFFTTQRSSPKIFLFLSLYYVTILFAWFIIPQQLPLPILPIVLVLCCRSFYRYSYN
jgi:hypothetical protein